MASIPPKGCKDINAALLVEVGWLGTIPTSKDTSSHSLVVHPVRIGEQSALGDDFHLQLVGMEARAVMVGPVANVEEWQVGSLSPGLCQSGCFDGDFNAEATHLLTWHRVEVLEHVRSACPAVANGANGLGGLTMEATVEGLDHMDHAWVDLDVIVLVAVVDLEVDRPIVLGAWHNHGVGGDIAGGHLCLGEKKNEG